MSNTFDIQAATKELINSLQYADEQQEKAVLEAFLTIVGTYADLLGWALKYIDWCEISENLLEGEQLE